MRAGAPALGTVDFRVAGGQTVTINLKQFAKGEDAGPTTKLDLTVRAANATTAANRSIATTFDSVSTTLGGSTNAASTPFTRILSWTDLGRLGPAPTYIPERNNIYAYFKVRNDAPDGARYCARAVMSPKSNTSLGGLASSPDEICFEIDNSLKPYISTSGADVHAGNCTVNGLAPLILNGKIIAPPNYGQGSSGSYIVSAADQITNFGSGGLATGAALTFGKGGRYGPMCRPTMVEMQKDITNAQTVPQSFDLGSLTSSGVIEFAGGGSGTITGTSDYRVTVNAPNGTVTIDGVSFGGKSDLITTRQNLPVVGVIARQINISKDTTAIRALLYASGTIDTCYEAQNIKSAANAATCRNPLFLSGFAMARDFSFKRTRAGLNGLQQSEILGFNPAFYLNPPQGFGSAANAVQYLGERAPLY